MIRIGIPAPVNGHNWLGGLNYFKSLATALNLSETREISVVYITNDASAFQDIEGNCVTVNQCVNIAPVNKARRLVNFALDTNISLALQAKKLSLDLLTHALPGRFMPIPAVHWMPDFQHKYFPHLFSKKDIWSRDRSVRLTQRVGHILFSSLNAENDFRNFYPALSDVKSHVLHFAPIINDYESQEIDVKEKYNIKQDYFYLPNQFWRHKNHRIVIEALSLLPDDFIVVCSGAINDYRGAQHIFQLRKRITELGLDNRFHMLGVIPRVDVYALMEQAVAVINPSFFEGWSTTVEEAKYKGKRLILSTLPVHREQEPPDALFFAPDDPSALADCMKTVLESFDSAEEVKRKKAAELSYSLAVSQFASDYISIIKKIT